MGRFRKSIVSTIKKITGSSSSYSHGSSSTRYTEHEESPMHEDEETIPTEEQEQPMEEDNDAPHLELEGDRET
jgi:hypothetical protein